MKPLNAYQVQKLAVQLSTFKGARLQEVRLSDSLVLLGLYTDRLHWWAIDLESQAPFVAYVPDAREIKPFKEIQRPIGLFIRAHLLDHRLDEVLAPPELGRVIELHFGSGEHSSQIEIRLFPRGQNLLVRKRGKKTVSWSKPLPLVALDESQKRLGDEVLPFSWDLLSTVWLQEKFRGTGEKTKSSAPSAPTPAAPALEKIAKLEKAMAKVVLDVEQKKLQRYSETGEWIKAHQGLAVPKELERWVDGKKSLTWNINHCFKKAKELKTKIQGGETRIRILKEQITALHATPSLAEPGRAKSSSSEKSLLQSSAAKGRTFDLGEGLRLYVGKSAADNMKLLRQARSWYFWLHLKDEPGAHAILHRNKNQNVSDSALHKAAHHLIEATYGEKSTRHTGEKLPVLIAECRFVRPIKGDRLGRVNYSDERVLLHVFHLTHS